MLTDSVMRWKFRTVKGRSSYANLYLWAEDTIEESPLLGAHTL